MKTHRQWNQTLTIHTLLFALSAATLSAGCMDEFDPPSLLDKPRPLGAEVRVAGDPTRATPRPGETATVAWIVAGPGPLPALAWAFVVCGSSAASDPQACAPAPLAVAQGTGAPSFAVAVPGEEALGTLDSLQVLGQICYDGAVRLDPQTNLPVCSGAGTTTKLDIAIDRSGQPNHNPALAERALWFDGVAWPADSEPSDCANLPTAAAGSKAHVLRLRLLAQDREAIVTTASDGTMATTLETLQISEFTTAGKLDHSYAFVDAAAPSDVTDVDITWDAPTTAPVDGRVHFVFVARDLRGGLGYVTRTWCVK